MAQNKCSQKKISKLFANQGNVISFWPNKYIHFMRFWPNKYIHLIRLWPQKKDVLQLKGFIQITSHNVKIMITKCTTMGMQRCQNLSVGKVRLRKQALATDRQLSGVKNGNKYSAAEKALKYWGVEKIKRRGNILEEGAEGGTQSQSHFTCLCVSPKCKPSLPSKEHMLAH